MPIRISDEQIDVVGTEQKALNFYDDDYTLQAQIYLKRDGTLNLPGTGETVTRGDAGVGVHPISSSVHTGILNLSQMPQALLLDGSRDLTGNLSADAGVTIDGVDLGSPGHGIEVSGNAYRIATEAAGDGLQGGGGSALAIDVSDFAGAGLEDDGSENLRITSSAAGDGLTGGGGAALAVGTPGTVTAASANGVTATSHTHAATTTWDGATNHSTILQSGASGELALDDLVVQSLTASRLLAGGAAKALESVGDLTAWIGGTPNRVIVADDGDGSVTLSGPQDIHTGASPTFANVYVPVNGYVGVDGGARWRYQEHAATGDDLISTAAVLYVVDYANILGGLHVGSNSDPGDDNLIVDGSATLSGSVTLGDVIETDSYVSQTTGWQVSYAGAADFRSVYADELSVKAFIAEIYSSLAGALIISESRARVSRDFTIPDTGSTATLYVEDHEGFENTQVFTANDYVLLRVIDTSGGGLVVADVWGQVTGYTDLSGGEQSWTWTTTTTGYSGSDTIYRGSIALDYGSAGSGTWSATVLDSAGSPYSQVQTWSGVTDGEPSGFTTHVRTGNLDGISGIGTEYGLWAGQGTGDDDPQILVSDSSAELRNLDLVVHDGSNVVYKVDYSTPYYALGNPAPSAFGTGTGVWAGLDSGAYKWRVGDPSGIRLQWNGTTVVVGDPSAEYITVAGSALELYQAGNKLAELASNALNIYDSSGNQRASYGSDLWVGASASTERLEWAAAGLSIYDKDDDPVFRVDPSNARVAFGADVSTEDTTALVIFGANSESYSGETFDEGDLLIGDPDRGNIFWDKSTGKIRFRGGENNYVSVDTDGGLKIEADGGSSYTWSQVRALSWEYSGALVGGMLGFRNTSSSINYVTITAASGGGYTSRMNINADLIDLETSTVVLSLDDQYVEIGGGLHVGGTGVDPGTEDAWIVGDVRIGRGLYVGSVATDPGTDDIWLDGDIRAAGGAYFGGTVTSDDPGAGYVVATNGVSGWLPFVTYECLPNAMTTGSNDGDAPFTVTVDRELTVDHWSQGVYVATTNDGSNYWTVTLREQDGTVIETLTTSAISANTLERLTATGIDHGLDPATSGQEGVKIQIDATGSPGALYLFGPAVYVL